MFTVLYFFVRMAQIKRFLGSHLGFKSTEETRIGDNSVYKFDTWAELFEAGLR